MSIESLADPVSEESPVGQDCAPDIQTWNLELMDEYLVERARQRGRERFAEQDGLVEAEARNAEAVRDEGKRRLASLEGILKDVMKTSAVNAEQVAKFMRDKIGDLLTKRGKDLRLLPPLCSACTYFDGLQGYAATVDLALRLIQAFPVDLFPRPDEDDPGDLWERVNAVSELVAGAGIQTLLGSAVVVESKQLGRITLAELVGGVHSEGEDVEVSDHDLGAFLGSLESEVVGTALTTLRNAEAAVSALVWGFDAGDRPTPKVGVRLARAAQRIAEFIEAGTSDTPVSDNSGSASPVAAPGAGVRVAARLQTREDAHRAIEEVIRFLEALEPAHPAPLLLKRANRLLRMSFIDIINDMAPQAMDQVLGIVGTTPSE